jgi:hypothetical protein
MTQTVIGLIEDEKQAQAAIEALLKTGIRREQLGMVSTRIVREAAAATAGASTGMLVGGLAGMVLAATALMLPGIGAALVAGPALTLFAGTTLGMIAGGLIGGLTAKGVPDADAKMFADGVKRGGTLVTVAAESDELAQRALAILREHGAKQEAAIAYPFDLAMPDEAAVRALSQSPGQYGGPERRSGGERRHATA